MDTKEVRTIELAERNKEILNLRAFGGWTLQEIGDKFGLTRERVRQICNLWGPRFGYGPALNSLSVERQTRISLRRLAVEAEKEILKIKRQKKKDETYLRVLSLIYLEDKTIRETAGIVGIHRNTVLRISNEEWDKYKHHFGY